jgi:hypothetical protein
LALGSHVFAACLSSGVSYGFFGSPWHREEAPRERARVGVVGRHVAAHAELGAAVAEDHLPLHDARRHRDRVGPVRIDRERRPHHLARLRVERLQPAVERPRVDASAVHGDASVHDVAAGGGPDLARHLRIMAPQELARARVEREHDAPRARGVDHAVDGDRRRLVAARQTGVEGPGEAEPCDVVRVDLRERAEALLGIAAAVGQPALRLGARGEEPRVVDALDRAGGIRSGRARAGSGCARACQCDRSERSAPDPYRPLHAPPPVVAACYPSPCRPSLACGSLRADFAGLLTRRR